jgi:hypothetical protein
MARAPRILANLLLPPPVAALSLFLFTAVFGSEVPRWRDLALVILCAYVFAAVPSVIHTILMERFYRRGLLPTERKAIIISSGSGLFAGFLVAIIFTVDLSHSFSALPRLWPYPLLGAVTGAIVALLILVISRAQQKNA